MNVLHISTTSTTSCRHASDMKTWMTQNKLKLNNDKTELMKSNRTIFPDVQPTALYAGTESHSSTVIYALICQPNNQL